MRLNQVGLLLHKKQYGEPQLKIVQMSADDVVRTSGDMGWGDWGDWNPGREDTFFGVEMLGGNS